MTFLVATNVVASRPPKRRPTGTPTARANKGLDLTKINFFRTNLCMDIQIENKEWLFEVGSSWCCSASSNLI